jgi:D-alanyl-D-alanine carboxypeptidase (penicillin-binding protein 5/6)
VAGFHIVATAKRGNKRLIAVVLGAKNKKIRSRQTKEILDYGFRKLGYNTKLLSRSRCAG